ncbi:MAG: hypothetical protein WDO70_01960 [Alphaproteobacteria bacterium]
MRNSCKSFHWLVGILQKHSVPFVVGGGLAVRSYGAQRPLQDIDVDIRAADFPRLVDDIKPYITFGPARLVDENWDLPIIVLNHHGQDIDICGGDDTKIFDAQNNIWVSVPMDLAAAAPREIFGLTIPVMTPEQLIAYKTLLKRPVDIEDIAALEGFLDQKAQRGRYLS